jgi:hypothetical protein
MNIHTYTYTLLHIEGSYSPQSVGHNVHAYESVPLLFICCFRARWGPYTSIPMKKRPSSSTQLTIGSSKQCQAPCAPVS